MYFFTADSHLGKEDFYRLSQRNFSSNEEHDEAFIENVNKIANEDDYLVVVGDFCEGDPSAYLERIKPRVILVFGNHDDESHADKYFKSGDTLYLRNQFEHKIWCHHYPTLYWRDSHKGSLHLYGHTHDVREELLDRLFPNRRSMDVGLDTAQRLLGEYRPFSLDEIYGFLAQKSGHDILDFYKVTNIIRHNFVINDNTKSLEIRKGHIPEGFRACRVEEFLECIHKLVGN